MTTKRAFSKPSSIIHAYLYKKDTNEHKPIGAFYHIHQDAMMCKP